MELNDVGTGRCASFSVIVYRFDEGGFVQILACRKDSSFENLIILPSEKPGDGNGYCILPPLICQVEKETGLKIRTDFFIGIYDPEDYQNGDSDKKGQKIVSVFAATIMGGKLKESDDKNFYWAYPEDFADKVMPLKHALLLVKLANILNDLGGGCHWCDKQLAI